MTKPVKPVRLHCDPISRSDFVLRIDEADATIFADRQNLASWPVVRTVTLVARRFDSRVTRPERFGLIRISIRDVFPSGLRIDSRPKPYQEREAEALSPDVPIARTLCPIVSGSLQAPKKTASFQRNEAASPLMRPCMRWYRSRMYPIRSGLRPQKLALAVKRHDWREDAKLRSSALPSNGGPVDGFRHDTEAEQEKDRMLEGRSQGNGEDKIIPVKHRDVQ